MLNIVISGLSNTPLCRFGRQYHQGSKTKPRVVQIDWLWILPHTDDNKENQSSKCQFPFTRFAVFEYHEEMFIKVANKNIFTGCLVPIFASVEAEQYGEGIIKID